MQNGQGEIAMLTVIQDLWVVFTAIVEILCIKLFGYKSKNSFTIKIDDKTVWEYNK